ncbi:MAG TPA: ATP-binding protein [Bacteroidia bacterium]|jgi:PAS domain S-box-containing protein|nr:ATP-binding protein [Bacteroidia bacterium]
MPTSLSGGTSVDAIFHYAGEGILVADSKGEIIRINPAAESMFGYEPGELTGKKIEILIPDRFGEKHVHHRDQYNENPHSRKMGIGFALYGKRKNGTEFPVEVSLSPFTSNGQNFVIGFIIDITIRKKQQDELELLARNLKDSNAELENFAYISSHDLQEPLRKIQSFGDRIQMMEGANLSEKSRDYLSRMLNAASRMQNLINDLLSFSRLTTRAQEFMSLDLNRVLEEVKSDMEITIEKTGAKITSSKLPVIEAEPTQMRQLFQNLLSNAIKFRKEDQSPVIDISWEDVDRRSAYGPGMINLKIRDNGIGFDEKYNDRIFNIFQRLDGKKYEGSGIGLSICKKIALRHNGNIIAYSKPGEGTTFVVTLPLKQPINQNPKQ